MLSVRFWGVRGAIPCPGPDSVIYGGNTSCLEIRADNRLVIVDLGTGARPLGDWIMANEYKKNGKIDADIFVTHTHWDHIMGFPMFSPSYAPGATLRITGPVSSDKESLETIIRHQLSFNYWPICADELSAKITFNQIDETTLDLGGGLTVTSKYLNHTISCLGYRINYNGKSIAAVFDHEPYCGGERFNEAQASEENEKIARFFKDADILIHDAQYSQEEFSTHLGWGHTSYDHAVKSAQSAGVKKLVFFHHDPSRTDKQLKKIEKSYAKISPVKIVMAREGITLQA